MSKNHKSLLMWPLALSLTAAMPIAWAQGDVPAKADANETSGSYQDALASGGQGPAMIRLPAGKFIQGSSDDEDGRDPDEGPVREVSIRAFALGEREISRAEFGAFVKATGYQTEAERNTPVPTRDDAIGCFTWRGGGDFNWKEGANWRNPGFEQTDAHPAGCVSWNDANAYIEWLNRETGKQYRLPSESELEYAIRAGSATPWPWGSDPEAGCAHANLADTNADQRFPDWGAADCDDGHLFTAPVGSRAANAFGLFDTLGNVWEWTRDCKHPDYRGAPVDGSAWTDGAGADCSMRVLRGGSWDDIAIWLRSANRSQDPMSARFHYSGFRLAHD
jgi:formylglycine-generating enzyme required for sulfatase activity